MTDLVAQPPNLAAGCERRGIRAPRARLRARPEGDGGFQL